jgi:3'-5' exoribonuclease
MLRELVDGQEIEAILLVRDRQAGPGGLRLTLADRSGAIVATACDTDDLVPLCEPGAAVAVVGRLEGAELALRSLRPAEPGEYEEADLVAGPPRTAAHMEADLRDLIAQVQSPHLRTLLDRVLGPEAPTWPAFRDAPAAKRYHQAYPHGLLEHSLSVGEAVAVISTTFPGIDRDVAITGALLHDIGKLDAYTSGLPAIDLTDLGKLHGEIALGYYRIRRELEEIPGFPPALAAAVLHIILSHHGQLEHGSPVVPCTREATLVHMIDNLGGRLGSFDRLEKELPHGSAWSAYDRALGGGAFFGQRRAA